MEALARRLHAKLEQLDPSGETWDSLTIDQRDLYCLAVEHVLSAPRSVFEAAWLAPCAGDYPVRGQAARHEQTDLHDDPSRKE